MTTVSIELPCKPHINQVPLMNSPFRFNVFACGRRFGKTEVEKIRAMYRAPTQRVWWLMPTYDSGQPIWRDFENTFRPLERTLGVYINKSERLIQFPSGGFLQVKSADSQLRSAGLDHIIIDEAAFVDDGENLWHNILRPMLVEGKGSADFSSSTNGRNWFWRMFQNGLDPNEPDWKQWHYTSYDNPLLDRAEIDDIKRNTPERVFKQEYMAEFLEDGGAVFRNLTACIDSSILIDREHGIYPIPQGKIIMGLDWARHNDYTVLIAIDTATKRIVDIDRFNQVDWTLQRGRVETMAKRWNPVIIHAEANSIGEPNIEELRKSGLPMLSFTTTAASKTGLINSLALAFEQNDIHIPNDPYLLGELQSYTLERLPSGNYRYTAPSGLHDDMVISLALAWSACVNMAIEFKAFY